MLSTNHLYVEFLRLLVREYLGLWISYLDDFLLRQQRYQLMNGPIVLFSLAVDLHLPDEIVFSWERLCDATKSPVAPGLIVIDQQDNVSLFQVGLSFLPLLSCLVTSQPYTDCAFSKTWHDAGSGSQYPKSWRPEFSQGHSSTGVSCFPMVMLH